MDLISSEWMPAKNRTNDLAHLSPLDLGDPRWQDLAAPRPDFQGAAYQFLIGLLQTAFAPSDRDEWSDRLVSPPSRSELGQAFAPIRHAFLLESPEGPAFLQDLDLQDAREVEARDLIFEYGSDASEFFCKPAEGFGLCDSCAAHALATMQFNAPSGGRGTRTSLRGGGPITTLLLPESADALLWERLWLNVIPADELGCPPVTSWSSVLPWLAPTRRSDGPDAVVTTPESVHPLQAYWSMSRRIRLDWTGAVAGQCSVCGAAGQRLLQRFQTRHGGTNYEGAWMHPLSPYVLDPKGEKPPIARKGQPGGLGYRDWLGLTYGTDADHTAALAVRSFVASAPAGTTLRLWSSGADFDNMKLRGWYDSVVPLYAVELAMRGRFVREVGALLETAVAGSKLLNDHVKAAWNANLSDPAVRQSFWEATEPAFFEALRDLAAAGQSGDSDQIRVRQQWLRTVRDHALALFDSWTLRGPIESLRLDRVVTSRGKLAGDLYRKKPMKELWQSVRATEEAAA
ncbi:MAG TPA: type I-E CRISPR-associated protein Cse1/CasA [Gemmatimonadales bacterium]|nr:type I-E CRISPR-associated protein Cse1/CasA [Gemmatimonadales bacterium]